MRLVTCFAWDRMMAPICESKPFPFWKLALYTLALVALIYSHPLGLLMAAALGLAALIDRRALALSWFGTSPLTSRRRR